MSWADQTAAANAIQLRTFGTSITYTPDKGLGSPIITTAILTDADTEQSSAPGYFAAIHVDPAVITAPARGDLVTWADGTIYVVAKIAPRVANEMPMLAIHRKSDPPEDI